MWTPGAREDDEVVLTGSNLPAVGEYNQTVVLDAIRRHPDGSTRSKLATATGLSSMTVANVCRRLLASGLIEEHGTRVSGPGKPPGILRLNPAGGFSIGVHIDPAVVTYVVVDLAGEVRDHTRSGTPSAQDPASVIDEMGRSINALIETSGVDRSRVLGIGIATPGPVNIADGIVLNPPMLPHWHRVPLRTALSAATGLPVLLEKDVTAAAVAELWYADAADSRDFAFMYYGTGLGTGIAVGGEVVRGVSSNAGDPGHMTVDPNGPECVCGRRGCVGYSTTPRALVERAQREGIVPGAAAGIPEVDAAFTALAALARAGDAAAYAVVADAARQLARAVVVLVNLLDIERVIFGGPFWSRIASIVLDVLPSVVRSDPALVPPHDVRFTESVIPVDVAAVGAATLVFDSTFSPRASTLLISAG
ncbi:ROK family transcriptional regulator [Asanoa siamensis]|uniref:ROK family transcriptional regulator n=1 Tax=Asanoa siamensis TaxID=926357 RepID=UPI001942D3C8|nr:ROK family transcriptional regulator [Asanoa siamensis]